LRDNHNSSLIYLENEAGEYLMLHRVKKKNDINHDKWIGVGGGFEHGESPEECALRETFEETGLTLTDYRLRGIVTFDCEGQETLYMYLFTASAWTGELSECSEGDLEWVPKKKVYSLPIWEGDKIFFRLLEEGRPFFSLKLSYDAQDVLLRAALDGKELPL
jgi:8-oxo-dGTP diphosphatase